MTSKITIVIECDDADHLNSIVNMISFMAMPNAGKWTAEIEVEDCA